MKGNSFGGIVALFMRSAARQHERKRNVTLELLGKAGKQPQDDPFYEIETEEQATNWMHELVDGVKRERVACDTARTRKQQQSSYLKYMIRYGSALGTVMALHRCRKLSDQAYAEFRQEIMNTFIPTTTTAGPIRG